MGVAFPFRRVAARANEHRAKDAGVSPDPRVRVVDQLTQDHGVEAATVTRARTVAERTGQPVEQTLSQMGVISDVALASAYAEVSGCGLWDPLDVPPSVELSDLGVTAEFLRQKRLIPLERQGQKLVVAACDPLDVEALAGLIFATGLDLQILVATPADWRRALDKAAPEADQAEGSVDERRLELDIQLVADTGRESDAARLLTSTLEAALARSASDIHFEPRRFDLRLRLRTDGRLVDFDSAPVDLAAAVVSRIKVLAGLDLGERRLPQDGRATFVVAGRPIDARISTSPSAFGEGAVMRLLDRTSVGLDFESLGFTPAQRQLLEKVAHSPHGIFLVTGPTGSGKTTTLYSLLNSFAKSEKKILSIEDPIEYHFQHVVQTQASPAIGLTFATALRSFLRQDPDVILVGEIRDAETAQVAIQAAMTGHLVLASLHANDAIKVAPRLLDMGVEPYQLGAAFLGSMAQRLVRKLCPECRRERALNAFEQSFARTCGAEVASTFEAIGCPLCANSGFRGRIALAEGFLSGDAFAAALATQEPMTRLAELAKSGGLEPMRADGCRKAALGLTTLLEVMAATGT